METKASPEAEDSSTMYDHHTSDSLPQDEIGGPRFELINPSGQAELRRLASSLSRRSSNARPGTVYRTTSSGQDGADLEILDTITGIEFGDPVLDPTHKDFDVHKWVRKLIRTSDDRGVKRRRAGFVFKDLNVSGSGSALNLQQTVGSAFMAPLRLGEYFSFGKKPEKQILRDFDGIVKAGEMLIVLGRPGSGCSTLLKSIAGELHGLNLDKQSTIHYSGISQRQMMKEFKGEVVYNQEVDKHFPHLTVGETLEFAAAARTPQDRAMDMPRQEWAKHIAQVVMAVFGLSHTYNTKVGSDFVRGVSGGERKRVSIAEMALAGSPIACWDNSTRGLDSATALEFVKSLRMSAQLGESCHAVAIYQASQAIYDVFDKAIVLYEGKEIYFGPTNKAKAYFEEMGWYCPLRQTTGDFLTSITNPQERKAREGFEDRVARSPSDFERYWKSSELYRQLKREIQDSEHEISEGRALGEFKESKRAMQSRHVRPESPYVISLPMQTRLCTKRAYQRLWNDKTSTVTVIVGQIGFGLILGSIFYGTPNTTNAFFARGSVLFFAILLNALMAISEINSLYSQRPIVEKQASYAFYHPFTEALAGIVADIPVKFIIATCFNIILYFLAGLRQDAGAFFIFFLFNFVAMLTMSMIFRGIAASTKTISQALAIAGVMVLAIVIYTGFTIPPTYMKVWFGWLRYINPVSYAFEALLVNEFHGRDYPCANFVPAVGQVGNDFTCAVRGAVAGQTFVNGDAYLASAYEYYYSHLWRNFGFLWCFLIFFLAVYLLATELNASTSSTAEVLVFRRGHIPKQIALAEHSSDKEMGKDAVARAAAINEKRDNEVTAIPPQRDIFTWRDVCYDIQIKGERRRLLDNVSGWVKPGTLTALMGVSGAGKTTLLDVLAQRTSIGVITGNMLVNGKSRDESFQRKTGYVQQQDLHMETSTVREALRFSAMLRQPKSVSSKEKYDFVEDVIKMLNMEDFAEAVVGVPGEGLNVEQRKLLTIGVELAAKPALLLFLDEPTSGLDSQSSWAIIAFLRKLANSGQAVLSTIHQPSSILFQEFDRLLFLAKGGKTVYFGNIGHDSEELVHYFSTHGARKCGDQENPAEYMLEIIGAGASGKATQDWAQVWKGSEEATVVQAELDRIHRDMKDVQPAGGDSKAGHAEFAMPFPSQLWHVSKRVFQNYWRTPSYLFGKFILGIASALFIGFSFFQSDDSQQGLQNCIFSIFMITSIFSTLVQQIMPRFVASRSLYEVRERPSKAYSWAAFLTANIFVEIPYQILLGIVVFGSFYYPVFGIQSAERQGLMLLFLVEFFVFASTFSHLLIAALPDAETAGNIATLTFSLTLTFNGVLQTPSALPGFWIFMYRVSPLTYLVQGMAGTGLHERLVRCAQAELSVFDPPQGQTCGSYMQQYLAAAPGQLYNPNATQGCEYCPLSNADQFLAGSKISWDDRWRNFGLLWAYIVFNIAGAVVLYYFFRVRKGSPSEGKGLFAGVAKLFRRGEKSDSKEGKQAEGDKVL